MKIAHLSVLAALTMASQAAFAQAPSGPPPGFGGPPGGTTTTTTTTTGNGGAGEVTNLGSAVSGTMDTTSTDTMDATTTTKGELVNTGGEPELMVLAGLFLAACGLLLYRKTAAQAA